MANYTAADIKDLREKTGAGMLDVKKALDEADGDSQKALEIIRIKGLKGVAKREDRAASEGLVAVEVVTDDAGETATVIELNCETDFVAKNEKFIALSQQVLSAIVAAQAADVTTALSASAGEESVEELITSVAATLGEKVELRRVARVSGPKVTSYLHKTARDLPPTIAALVVTDEAGAAVAKEIAQHVAALSPLYVNREAVPTDVVDNERRIAEETARAEGGNKPDHIITKIAENRLNKYFEDVVLLEQPLAKDPSKTVGQILTEAKGQLTDFLRFRVGA